LRLDFHGFSHPVAELAATAEGYRAVSTGATIIGQYMTAAEEMMGRRMFRFKCPFLSFLRTKHELVFVLSPFSSAFTARLVGSFLIF
jgi:hypothetical protein